MTDPLTTDGGTDNGSSERSTCLMYELNADEHPTGVVVRAVASLTDTPPIELDPLHDTIPPRHLDRVVQQSSGKADIELSFMYSGCGVTVTPTEVVVRRIEDDS